MVEEIKKQDVANQTVRVVVVVQRKNVHWPLAVMRVGRMRLRLTTKRHSP